MMKKFECYRRKPQNTHISTGIFVAWLSAHFMCSSSKILQAFLFVSWHISFLFNQELYSDKEHELREWEWEGKCVNVNWWTFHNHRISYVQIAWHIQIRLYFIAKPHLFAATFSFSFGLWWLYSIHSGVTRAGYGECIQRIVLMGLVCGVFLCHDSQVTY